MSALGLRRWTKQEEMKHKPVKLKPSNPISIQFACFLAQPDVGFATGTGTEVAIEASDVTLIKGSVMCIITAIEISRATMRDTAQCAPELGRRVWLQRAWHSGGDGRLVSVYSVS